MSKLKLGSIFYFLFFTVQLFAQEDEMLLEKSGRLNISPVLYFLYDTNSTYTFSNVISDKHQKEFKLNKQLNPNFPNTTATIWGKFTLNNQTDEEWVLEINEVVLDSFVLYIPKYIPKENEVVYQVSKTGMFSETKSREFSINRYVFDLKIPPKSKRTYYFKVNSVRLQFPMFVMTFSNLVTSGHQYDLLDGAYYGFMMIMLLYNLFLFFGTKDKNYLLYSLYLFTAGFYISWIKGHFTELLNEDWLWVNNYGVIFSCISTMTSILFSVYFLELKKHLRKIYYVLIILFWLFLIPITINILGNYVLASKLIQFFAFVSLALVLVSSIIAYQKGYLFARFFIIAWTGFISGVLIYILKTVDVLPLNFWTANAMQIGSSWEMLLLSLALTDRINMYRQKIKKSQKELKDLNNVLTSQNKRLEEYTYMVSHNLRGPIASLLGIIELYDEKNLMNSFNKEVIKHVRTASKDLDKIVTDLNTSIRTIENVNLYLESISINEVIQKAINRLRLSIDESNALIHFNLEVKEIITYPQYLQSIIQNLLMNAIKFRSLERNLEISIYSSIKYIDNEKYCCIEVKDNGIGIDFSKYINKDQIFKFYYQGNEKTEGRGVGLYLVRLQIEILGGIVDVYSKFGKGSTFSILFPYCK